MNVDRLMRATAAVMLIGAVVAAGVRRLAHPQPPSSGAHGPAEPIPNRYQVKMVEGVALEVVAVSSFPSGPKSLPFKKERRRKCPIGTESQEVFSRIESRQEMFEKTQLAPERSSVSVAEADEITPGVYFSISA